MSKKIYGVTVGTPMSPAAIAEKLKPVKTVNGVAPDENGNVNVEGGSGGTASGLTLTSPDGTVWNITVSNTGVITATKQTDDGGGETVTFTVPVVNLRGDLAGISGDDYVNVTCNFVDSTNGVDWTDYATIAYQGSSSMNFTNVEDGVDKAKNYKIKLFTDEARETKNKRTFKDWHSTNNYHIKANYGDCTNFMNNMMMHFLTKSYQYLTPLPREGARYTVDGFPVLLYINDVFCGIRFWNLKQDDKVYNLADENDLCYQIGLHNGSSKGDNSGAFVYGNLNSGSNAGKNFADAHAEIDYYWEDRVWDKTGNHPDVLYNTIQWVSEATDAEFKASLEQHFDKEYLINYFVMMMACGMGDSICKNFNMLYFPDKGKWYATFWDMDFAFGTAWELGTSAYNIDVLSSKYGASRLFTKLWTNFKSEIVSKYNELRSTVLTVAEVEDSINAVWGNITAEQIAENYKAKYNGTGGFKTNGASYVSDWAQRRFSHMDTIMVDDPDAPEGGESVPTTAISLNATSLAFTSTDSQTLTATVTPANSTEAVVWSSNNEAVAKVIDGVVVPVASGNCEIIATSGACFAKCAVSVSIAKTVDYSAGYINDSGALTSLGGNYVSNLYDAASGFVLVSVPTSVKVIRIAQYDADKNFIKRTYSTENVSDYFLVLESNTQYIRVGFRIDSATTDEVNAMFACYTINGKNALIVEPGTVDTTGVEVDQSGRMRTDYIPVTAGDSVVSSIEMVMRCFDASKKYISSIPTAGTSKTATVPDGCAYIRIVYLTGEITVYAKTTIAGTVYWVRE